MKFFYYDLKNKKNIIFRSKSRELAVKRIEKITHEPWYVIDDRLKSDLQMGVLMAFNLKQ